MAKNFAYLFKKYFFYAFLLGYRNRKVWKYY